ncbi:ABC transporter substrate-binding protein [Campylobacter upsaliensis]|nr:toluene tolerance protein [Campylobacter upsaliensis]EDP6839802.1 toluene tolerance protein [Campylobacter upsaliensis]EFS9253200.1 toluene tolerance protein [Campylobacter upsaliensis]EJQ4959597.1 ABC transporter substrate-binding protein [Campylobacter upsaliensis]ELP8578746.1 ABC transporter substrate-binding protein [Campylobacter upsaliensis]
MRKILLLLTIALSAFALNLNEIESFMQKNIDESLKILQNTKGDKKAVAQDIFKLFDGVFDYKLMAKLSLSKYYQKLSQDEVAEFNKAFEASLKKSFTDKLELYKDQILKVEGGEQKNEKRYFLTSSMLVDGEKKFIIFKFYKENDDWLIYDVDVLGVSIIQTYRSQFGDILENGTFKDLLNKLNDIIIK